MGPGPIILGGIAIVGTGYAFKKFVYDPHLAPLIEAAIEQARQRSQHHHFPWETPQPRGHARAQQQAEPASVPVSASTTAISPSHTTLRRRSVQKNPEDFEMDSKPLLGDTKTSWEGAKHDVFLDPPAYDSTPRSGGGMSEKNLPDRPESAQDAEIRSLLFQAPPTPATFETSGEAPFMAICPPRASALNPPHPTSPTSPSETAPSTTFSFLSLSPSQLPSPQTPARAINNLSLVSLASADSTPREGQEFDEREERGQETMRGREDDIISLSTFASTPTSPTSPPSTLPPSFTPTDLGLTFLHPHPQLQGQGHPQNETPVSFSASVSTLGSPKNRRPMSVVSMSEGGSEAGEASRGDSEWEEDGWSDTGRV
ncbi:hypothetical protein IAR50_005741 [Cryptococcus sp. DSM 104548]